MSTSLESLASQREQKDERDAASKIIDRSREEIDSAIAERAKFNFENDAFIGCLAVSLKERSQEKYKIVCQELAKKFVNGEYLQQIINAVQGKCENPLVQFQRCINAIEYIYAGDLKEGLSGIFNGLGYDAAHNIGEVLLTEIHRNSTQYYGDEENKIADYLSSPMYKTHKEMLGFLMSKGHVVHGQLKTSALEGEKAPWPGSFSSPYSFKVPAEVFKLIQETEPQTGTLVAFSGVKAATGTMRMVGSEAQSDVQSDVDHARSATKTAERSGARA